METAHLHLFFMNRNQSMFLIAILINLFSLYIDNNNPLWVQIIQLIFLFLLMTAFVISADEKPEEKETWEERRRRVLNTPLP